MTSVEVLTHKVRAIYRALDIPETFLVFRNQASDLALGFAALNGFSADGIDGICQTKWLSYDNPEERGYLISTLVRLGVDRAEAEAMSPERLILMVIGEYQRSGQCLSY